jgi:hypothetical protein
MRNTNTGGPAFPTKNYQAVVPKATGYAEGMTLRDYFAAKSLRTFSDDTDEHMMENAIKAYKQADAMLKARQA